MYGVRAVNRTYRIGKEQRLERPQPAINLAGAIIEHPRRGFLLQLRDATAPTYPCHWGLFGGHMEAGESPQEALWRELAEELGFTPAMAQSCILVQRNSRADGGTQYIFHILTDVTPNELTLGEGEAMRYFALGSWSGRLLASNLDQILADHLAGRRDGTQEPPREGVQHG